MTPPNRVVSLATHGVPALALALVLGCGGGLRVLEYDYVRFTKTSEEYSECFVKLDECKYSKVLVETSNGNKKLLRDIDENWIEAATERVTARTSKPGRELVLYDGNAISASFRNGQLSSLILLDGATMRVGDSEPLRLPATEKEIRKVFGAPRRVSYITGGPP
jgi:hypothetical protein